MHRFDRTTRNSRETIPWREGVGDSAAGLCDSYDKADRDGPDGGDTERGEGGKSCLQGKEKANKQIF